MKTHLEGRVVLVTGAPGGIGSAIAQKFAEEGVRLVLHYRANRAGAERLAKSLQGVEIMIAKADLAREAEVAKLFSQAVKRFGRVDTLIANAGSWETRDIPIHQMPLRQWRATLDCVLTSAFLSLREFFKIVARQKQGNAVLIASTAAVFGEAGHADYAAAKSAMAFGLLRTAKNELARLAPPAADYCGGRINAISPGWTAVPRTQSKLGDAAVVRKVAATRALPQIGRPEDMANLAVYLSSDALARHLTGQNIVVSGGMEGRLLWRSEEIDPSIAV